jgi:hypothetical protein
MRITLLILGLFLCPVWASAGQWMANEQEIIALCGEKARLQALAGEDPESVSDCVQKQRYYQGKTDIPPIQQPAKKTVKTTCTDTAWGMDCETR